MLNIGYTSVAQLPEDFGRLECLKKVDFTNCVSLERLPELFSELPKLENLNLWGYSQLQQLPGSMIGLRKVLRMSYTFLLRLPVELWRP